MVYVFRYTSRDTQKHLYLRYDIEELVDPFLLDKEMIDYLTSIYKDPYKVQNTQLEYRGLIMKATKTFTNFYTYFLYLVGQA